MPGESLEDVVEAHARAYVRGDTAAFASRMTPQALLQAGTRRFRASRYRVLDVTCDDDTGASTVRYTGRGDCTVEERWQRVDGAWSAVESRVTEVRPRLWERLRRFLRPAQDRAEERRDAAVYVDRRTTD